MMDWVEITVHTTTFGADIVSEQLMQEGATGTMVEDRADIPDPTKPNGIWEIIDQKLIDDMPEDVLVHAWFEPDSRFADRMSALGSRMTELKALDMGFDLGSLTIDTLNVRDEDWSEVWKKFYKPFKAGRNLVVKLTWETYEAQEGDRIIEKARAEGRRIIVLAGRPYHVDPEVNHGIDTLITQFGAAVVTEDSISHRVEKFPTTVLNQWTYHARLYAAAKYCCEQPDMDLVHLVSFGCGVDAITSDETHEILHNGGKLYTQLKIDEITNLGAVRIRLRSLFAALDEREEDRKEA